MSGSGNFGIKCIQDDGVFYSGHNTSFFLGCCAADPADSSDGACRDPDLREMTFDPKQYNQIPAQKCMSPMSAKWYTCAGTTPPYIGCCSSNPCDDGHCPIPAQRGARIAFNKDQGNPFLDDPTSTASTSTATLSTATTTSAASTSAPTAAAPPSGDDGHQGVSAATVVGISVGIAVGVLILAIGLFWWLRKRRAAFQQEALNAQNMLPKTPTTATTTPSTPSWLYSAAPTHSAVSPYASDHHQSTTLTQNSFTSDYYKTGKPTPTPSELPGSVPLELHGESSPWSPRRESGFSTH